MDQPLSEQEKEDMRKVLSNFYGAQTENWGISLRTFKLLEKLIEKTRACDGMMDLVPRPFGGGSVIRWGKKQVRDFILRKLTNDQGKHYVVCMRASAASMKTDFYMAGF